VECKGLGRREAEYRIAAVLLLRVTLGPGLRRDDGVVREASAGSLRARLTAFVHAEVGEMVDGDALAVPRVALDP
jgi:hypothetical protein